MSHNKIYVTKQMKELLFTLHLNSVDWNDISKYHCKDIMFLFYLFNIFILLNLYVIIFLILILNLNESTWMKILDPNYSFQLSSVKESKKKMPA